jgi:predicted Zn-dependent protease
MRNVLATLTIFLFSVLFCTSFWYVSSANVCPVPILYSLGDIDPRFNIEPAELKDILGKAEKVWEDGIGRDLFDYDERSSFAVNLIYDERQQMASTEEEWRVQLDVKEKESQGVIAEVKSVGNKYETLRQNYENERAAYDVNLSAYNEKVDSFNAQGGAPAAEYEKLQMEQKELQKFVNKLSGLEDELKSVASAIDTLGTRGNLLIEEYNAEVIKYNEIYGSRDQYTQGDFQRDRINVYKFSSKEELTKVIVHEFGHALGIGHVEGEASLMYYLMEDQDLDNIHLAQEDLDAIKNICKIK